MTKQNVVLKEKLKKVGMLKRYQGIRTFVYSLNHVTNQAHPNMTKANYIGAYETLNTLRVLEEVLDEDIRSFKLSNVNVEDIFGEKKNEMSEFIYSIFFDNNPYRYAGIKKKYDSYLKVMLLEEKYPLAERKNDLKNKENEIKRLEEIILCLEDTENTFDTKLGILYTKKRQLEQLKREYDEQEQLIYFETPEDFAVEFYNNVYSKMNDVKKVIISKIEYLERVLEV